MGNTLRGITGSRYINNFERSEIETLSSRWILRHSFIRTLAKGLSVWCNSATDANNIAAGFDPLFKLADTAGASTQVLGANGLQLQTNTTSADDAIVQPHTVAATNFLADDNLTCGDGNVFRHSWGIKTHSTISSMQIFAGAMANIKSAVGGTAGDDQVFWYYKAGTYPNWTLVVVKANAATYFESSIPVVAATPYVLSIEFRTDGTIVGYINGEYICTHQTLAATNEVFSPVCAVETDTTAARSVYVRNYMFDLRFA